jgi:hypothetical protein
VLYQQKEVMNLQSHDAAADLEEVSASCAHFSFSLLEFGEQLHDLLLILDELQLEVEERPNGRSWNWLKFWMWSKGKEADTIGNFTIGTYMPEDIQWVLELIESQTHLPLVLESMKIAQGSIELFTVHLLQHTQREDSVTASGNPWNSFVGMTPNTPSRWALGLLYMHCHHLFPPPDLSTSTGGGNGAWCHTC